MKQGHERSAVRLCDTDEIIKLIGVLEDIAAELDWQPGQQLHDYRTQAVHFGAYVDGALAGGMQLVPAPLCQTLPCELVWPEARLPRRAETAHISVLAIRREYRGTAELLWPLCVAMWRYCVAHRIADISLEVTPKMFRLYQRLGWPLEIVGDLRPHWGEECCYLCRMGTADVAGAMLLRTLHSAAYRDIVGMMSRPSEMSQPGGPSAAQPSSFPLQPAILSGIVVAEA